MKRTRNLWTILILVCLAGRCLAADIVLGPRLENETDDAPRMNRLYADAAANDTLVMPSGEYWRRGPVVWKGEKPVNVRAWGAHIRAMPGAVGPTLVYGGNDGKAWFDVEFIGPSITGNNNGAGVLFHNLARARIRTGLIRACTDGVVLHAGGGVGMNSLYLDMQCISGCLNSLRVECDTNSCINHVRFAHFQAHASSPDACIIRMPDGVNCSRWTWDDARVEATCQCSFGRFVGGPFVFCNGYWIEGPDTAVWQFKVLPGASVKFKGHYFLRAWHGGGVVE